ncbi:WXG100 family type VII secretion target [Streptomyces sp. URMC 126]|uniref:WXG100 family type VII secretion target n=1 Tax=Streptomyces sp. URMC 126 TaxID=3423401 RepID=UPI003F1D7BE5
MGDKLRLDDGNLNSLITDLGHMHDTLEAKINSLTGVVHAVEGVWKGDAARAYHGLQSRVNEDVRKLKELLAFTKEAMEASRQGFSQEEAERLNSFKGIGEGGASGVLGRFQVS